MLFQVHLLSYVETITIFNCIVLEIKYDGTHGIHPEKKTVQRWDGRFRLNMSEMTT